MFHLEKNEHWATESTVSVDSHEGLILLVHEDIWVYRAFVGRNHFQVGPPYLMKMFQRVGPRCYIWGNSIHIRVGWVLWLCSSSLY